jgi:hypothetical protein
MNLDDLNLFLLTSFHQEAIKQLPKTAASNHHQYQTPHPAGTQHNPDMQPSAACLIRSMIVAASE